MSISQVEGASCLHHCHHHHWLVKNWFVLFTTCQVLCALLPAALLPCLSTSWLESLLASLPDQPAFCCLADSFQWPEILGAENIHLKMDDIFMLQIIGTLLHHLPLLHWLPCLGQAGSVMASFKQPQKGGKWCQCCERGMTSLMKWKDVKYLENPMKFQQRLL